MITKTPVLKSLIPGDTFGQKEREKTKERLLELQNLEERKQKTDVKKKKPYKLE